MARYRLKEIQNLRFSLNFLFRVIWNFSNLRHSITIYLFQYWWTVVDSEWWTFDIFRYLKTVKVVVWEIEESLWLVLSNSSSLLVFLVLNNNGEENKICIRAESFRVWSNFWSLNQNLMAIHKTIALNLFQGLNRFRRRSCIQHFVIVKIARTRLRILIIEHNSKNRRHCSSTHTRSWKMNPNGQIVVS